MATTPIKQFLWTLLIMVLLFPTVYLFIPLMLLLTLPWRICVKIIAKIFRPNFGEMLSGLDASISQDNFQKPLYNLVQFFIVDGVAPIESTRAAFVDRVLAKVDKNGNLFYPELQQIVTRFLGYPFWRKESDFRLENHFREYDYFQELPLSSPHCVEEDLRRNLSGLMNMGWKEDSSPWEFLIIPNYRVWDSQNTQTIMISRIHHVMGDGVSIINMIMRDFAGTKFQHYGESAVKTLKRRNWAVDIPKAIIFPIFSIWQLAGNFVESYDEENCWHSRKKMSKHFYTSFSPAIEVNFIKDIKNKHRASFVAVLFSAMCGAMRQVMEEAGQDVPDSIAFFCPTPVPNHPPGLCNYTSFQYIRLPLKIKSPIARLRQINAIARKNRTNSSSQVVFWLTRTNGMLPNFLQRLFGTMNCSTAVASIFPAPNEIPSFCGLPVLESICCIPLGVGQQGITFMTMGTGGKLRVVANIEKVVSPPENIFRNLGQYIHEELIWLHGAEPRAHEKLRVTIAV